MSQRTPLAQDVFARTMAQGFDNRNVMRAPGGFSAFFGYVQNGSQITYAPNSSALDIDIILGSEKLAPMVPRASTGRVIEGQLNTEETRFTSLVRKFPLIEEEGDINSDQLDKRVFNEAQSESDKTRSDRLQGLAGDIRNDHMRRTARTYEYLAAQSVITGKQPAIMNTTNPAFLYDWLRPAANFITAAQDWINPLTDILGDVEKGCAQIRAKGRKNPDMLILSKVDAQAWVKNEAIQKLADNRRFELVRVDQVVPPKFQRFVDGGFVPFGTVVTPSGYQLAIFTYLDIYDDADGNPVEYLPDNKTIIASSDSRCDLAFGPGTTLPATSAKRQWYLELFGVDMDMPPMPLNLQGTSWATLLSNSVYCDAYASDGDKSVTVRNQSAPLFPTTETATFVTITTKPA